MIDQARLDELTADFGAEDLDEIIESFLAEGWEAMDHLGELLAAGRDEELTEQMHFLKGCARNIGAMELGDLCERFEQRKATFGPAEFLHLKAQFRAVSDFFADGDISRTA